LTLVESALGLGTTALTRGRAAVERSPDNPVARRLLVARFAVLLGVVGVATSVDRLWIWICALALAVEVAWSVTRVPASARRRLTANRGLWDAIGLATILVGVLLTLAPIAPSGAIVGCLLLFCFAVVRTLGVLPKRIMVDSQLRRRGVRLP
jgi:hypothetical protein